MSETMIHGTALPGLEFAFVLVVASSFQSTVLSRITAFFVEET